MTPTETTAILRQFNEWRRSEDETVEQPDPREIGEAIDAAIAMIERLEAAEKSDAESIAMYRKARDERDALRAKIERMERQEPAGKFIRHSRNGLWEQDGYGDNPDARPLYALPGAQAQPAPSIPDDVMRDAKRYRFLRAAKNIPISTEAARDPIVYDAAIDAAMLASAPEAKPCP